MSNKWSGHKTVQTHMINLQTENFNKVTLIKIVFGLMSRLFANGPRDRGSIPGQVIPKTQKMITNFTFIFIFYTKYIESNWEWPKWIIIIIMQLSFVITFFKFIDSISVDNFINFFIYISWNSIKFFFFWHALCHGYHHRNWWAESKSSTRLFRFHFTQISLEKAWNQLFQLWVNSRKGRVL